MRKIQFMMFFLALALGWASATVWADWVQDGGSLNGNTAASATFPSLALVNDTPYVAWIEPAGSADQLFVKHWNGGAWVQDGGSLNYNTGQGAGYPSMAVSNSTPYVAWDENTPSGKRQVHAKQWNGSGWTDLGILNINSSQHAYTPSLAVASDTRPWAAWSESDGTALQIFVKVWTGTIWTPGGGWGGSLNVSNTHSAYSPSIALNSTTPYVAWAEDNFPYQDQIYVKHWNGASWVQDGGSLNVDSGHFASGAKIVIYNGMPYVAWHEDFGGGSYQVYVKHWNGSNWVQDGASLNVNIFQSAIGPSLAVSNGALSAAWHEANGTPYEIYVKHWNGASWVQDGSSLNVDPLRRGYYPSLALSSNNTPYVAWYEENAAAIWQIYVKHWASAATPTPVTSATAAATTPQSYLKAENNAINPGRGEQASIQWRQPQAGPVTLVIYNILGDKVITLVDQVTYSGGQVHTVTWKGTTSNGGVAGSGIYLVHLSAPGYEARGKAAVVK